MTADANKAFFTGGIPCLARQPPFSPGKSAEDGWR
jgi:hypothetical protein